MKGLVYVGGLERGWDEQRDFGKSLDFPDTRCYGNISVLPQGASHRDPIGHAESHTYCSQWRGSEPHFTREGTTGLQLPYLLNIGSRVCRFISRGKTRVRRARRARHRA